jgi:hypothetical protein
MFFKAVDLCNEVELKKLVKIFNKNIVKERIFILLISNSRLAG